MIQRNNEAWRGKNYTSHSRGSVLLVDEDREDLHYFRSILEEQGYQVRGSESFEEGTRLLDSEAFDFIIVSQGGPTFEGRRVLEHVNQIDRHLPLMVVARCLDMGCYLEAMQLGAVDYLAQPVNVQELERVVETHIRVGATA